MSHRLTIPVALAIVLLGCTSDRSPVGPSPNERPALSNGGPPTTFDTGPYVQPIASAACGFTVQEWFEGKAKVVEFRNGRLMSLSPKLNATVTNLDNGRSETFGVTGAFHITTLPNGNSQYVVTGRNLLGFDDAVGQVYVLSIGRFTFTLDEQGSRVTPIEGDGKLVDLCDLLS